jgi:hypothetical protein
MSNKHNTQLITAKVAIELLSKNVSNIFTYEELQNELNLFMESYIKDANIKNNRPNKSVMGFINYFKENKKSGRNIEAVLNKKTISKKSYKDYLPEYILLRNQGLSYQKIAEYSKKYYKQSVSKDTIRNALKEVL